MMILWLAACADVDTFAIEVDVEPGAFPELFWEGRSVGSLTVSQLDARGEEDFPVWRLSSPTEDNPIESPHRLGEVPQGTEEQADLVEPELVDGETYQVQAVRFGRGGRTVAVGIGEFSW